MEAPAARRRPAHRPVDAIMAQKERRIAPVTRSREQARRAYDRTSRWYDLLAGGIEARYRNAALEMLAAVRGDVVLELGFGSGHAVAALAAAVGPAGRVYGVDISARMVAVARSRAGSAGLAERVCLQQGDALRLPYQSAVFDKIFMSFVLELFDTPEIPAVLRECYRTLRPGGRICVAALSRQGGSRLMTRLYERVHEKLPQYFDCRPIYAQPALEQAGFRTLSRREMPLLGLCVELVLSQRSPAAVP